MVRGGGDARTVNASLGTWNYGGQNLGLAFVLWADLQAPTIPDGFKVTVTGPSSASPVTYGPLRWHFPRQCSGGRFVPG